MGKKYCILPGNDDQNRGDQALVWETKRIAEDAGFKGEYYMFSDPSMSKQSITEGITPVEGILLHPSRGLKHQDNITYNTGIIVRWGIRAIFDFLYSSLLLVPGLREIILKVSSERVSTAYNVLKESEIVFVKGGGFVHSYGELTALYKHYYMLYHILLAESLGKKIIMMPNSFGPFEGFQVKSFLRKVLKNIDLIFARESISLEALRDELHISADLFPDLGFFLEKEYVDISYYLNKSKKNVALTARPYRFPNHKDGKVLYQKYIKEYADFVVWLISNNYNPVFVEHVYNKDEHEKDLSCINRVCEILKDKGIDIRVISNRDYNCKHLKSIYSQFDYLVGTRFHSVIFALAEGIPAMAITYGGNKGDGIMKDFGLEDLTVKIDDFTARSAITVFEKMICRDFKFGEINHQLAKGREKMVSKIVQLR